MKRKSMPIQKVESSWMLPESTLRAIAEHAEAIARLLPQAMNFQTDEKGKGDVDA